MREKSSDYFENSRRATYVHRDYGRQTRTDTMATAKDFWGLSAGDGPGNLRARSRRQRRFSAMPRAARPSARTTGRSRRGRVSHRCPFAPEICLPALRQLQERYPGVIDNFRMPSGFNPSLANRRGFGPSGWVSEGHYGLDQGIVVMMIENHRSRLIWDLMRSNQHIRLGLSKAGFTGGWLSQPASPPRRDHDIE